MGPIISSIVYVVLSLNLIYLECVQGVEDVKGYPPSSICATQECAPYQVVHTQKQFEIRNYTNSIWIGSGNITTVSYSVGRSAGYLRTYVYYKGENEDRFEWKNNTQPVLTDVIPNTSYDSIYRVYLHVPNDYQNKTLPKPYSSNVEFVKLPPKKLAAVVRFDGLLTDEMIATELAALKNSLKGTPWESAAAPPGCSVADYSTFNEVILWFDQN
ncbi:hypothetical protein C2S52_012919 [Perilla frutescens var. hirtella]|nr:hypothetical protein C2S52_012919 [Perilla frutescens var. hirtella]